MGDGGHRYVGAFLLLVLVWIGVFWWWEPSGRESVTFEPPVVVAIDEPVQAPDDVEAEHGDVGGELRASDEPETLVLPSVGTGTVSEAQPDSEGQPNAGETGGAEEPDAGVIAPEFRDVVIRRGDTYASIARRELGSSSLAGVIARANPLKDPRRLRVGQTLRVPTDPANIQGRVVGDADAEAAVSPMIEYTVQRGDTLGGIARRFYGSSRFAEVIFEANRDQMRSMDTVRLGQVLMIPPASEVTGAN